MNNVIEWNRVKKEELNAKLNRKEDQQTKLFAAVDAARDKGAPASGNWNADDCKALCKHKKHPDDSPLAKRIGDLKKQCDRRKDRPSPIKPSRLNMDVDQAETDANQEMPLLPGQDTAALDALVDAALADAADTNVADSNNGAIDHLTRAI